MMFACDCCIYSNAFKRYVNHGSKYIEEGGDGGGEGLKPKNSKNKLN